MCPITPELYGIVNRKILTSFWIGTLCVQEENGNPKLNEEWQETIETQRNNPHLFPARHPQYFVKGIL